MPGNQPGSPGDIELKIGYMVKRSQGKSALGAVNFKKRVFVLTPNRLSYFDGNLEKRGGLKGHVDLNNVKVVEKVLDTAFDKPSFQVVHGELTLYVITNDETEQENWIHLIRQYCRNNGKVQDFYHPGLFISNKWSCCDHRSKHSYGCTRSFIQEESQVNFSLPPSGASAPIGVNSNGSNYPISRKPLPPTPIDNGGLINSSKHTRGGYGVGLHFSPPPPAHQMLQMSVSNQHHQKGNHHISSYSHHNPSGMNELPPPPVPKQRPPSMKEFEVIAMYDYAGVEKGDLPLRKGQKVMIFDYSRDHWWRARNDKGHEGFVPSNYVKKVGLESEEWYFPNLSRARAENILKSEGKEGTFVIRVSSRENMYTLSICHEGQVRHYHIKEDSDKNHFISEKHRFPTITELIEYHKLNGGGLVTRLRRPPAQLVPNIPVLQFDSKWEIKKEELTLGKELGSGQFGRVVAGKWHNNVDVAIKMMKEGAMNEDDFIEEAKVMQKFQHENLVKLYGVCIQQGPIFIVTELMVNGCLLQYLRNNRHLIDKVDIILDMAIQVCSAMRFLEENKFIHRDLAARNCLVGERNSVKVGDFGLARFVVDDEYTASEGTKFPIKWAAPEVITHARFSSKSDVWSFGILLWELWTGGKTPYPAFTNPQVLDEVLMGYRLDRPKACPPEIFDLMWRCWIANSDDRPSFLVLHESLTQLVGDDYSESVD